MAKMPPQDDAAEESNTPSPQDSENQDSGESQAQVPEEFQNRVHELIAECDNRKMLDYISSCVSEAHSDMAKEEAGETPDEYSTEDMPK